MLSENFQMYKLDLEKAEEPEIKLSTSRGVGWGGRWEGVSKRRGYMYTYSWFMLRFDRKQQNSVKQLSFNKKLIN